MSCLVGSSFLPPPPPPTKQGKEKKEKPFLSDHERTGQGQNYVFPDMTELPIPPGAGLAFVTVTLLLNRSICKWEETFLPRMWVLLERIAPPGFVVHEQISLLGLFSRFLQQTLCSQEELLRFPCPFISLLTGCSGHWSWYGNVRRATFKSDLVRSLAVLQLPDWPLKEGLFSAKIKYMTTVLQALH